MIKNGGYGMRCSILVQQRTFRKLIFNSCGIEFVDLMGEEFVFIAVYTFPSTDTQNKASSINESNHPLTPLYICLQEASYFSRSGLSSDLSIKTLKVNVKAYTFLYRNINI